MKRLSLVLGIVCLVALVALILIGPPNNPDAHTEWLGWAIGMATLSIVNLMPDRRG